MKKYSTVLCAWFIACTPDPRYLLVDSSGNIVEIFSDPISCEWAEEELGGNCYTVR